MALLFDEDYEILRDSGIDYEEDEINRYLIIKNFNLKPGLYQYDNQPADCVEVLVVIPSNYNTSGTDMLWTHPPLVRIDGKPIPAVMGIGGGDARFYKDKEYCRWSRHYNANSWSPKEDNILKILSRIEWALKNPDSQK